MSLNTFVWLAMFVVAEGGLLTLDVADLCRRRRASNSPSFALSALAFLGLITLVFFAIQWSGSRLVPSQTALFEHARALIAGWSQRPPAATPLTGWPLLAVAATVFYLAGLWDYLTHRWFSHSRWFWWTHEYHHLPKEINVLMPGILTRPFGFIPVALTGTATLGRFKLPAAVRERFQVERCCNLFSASGDEEPGVRRDTSVARRE